MAFLKIALGAGLLYCLIDFELIDFQKISLALKRNKNAFLPGIGLIFLSQLCNAWRLQLLLKIPYTTALYAHLISLTSGLFLPGAISTDVIKAMQIKKSCPEQSWKGIASGIIIDRLLGFYAMLAFGFLSALASISFIMNSALYKSIFALLLLIFFLASAGIAFSTQMHRIRLLDPMLARLERWLPLPSLASFKIQRFFQLLTPGLAAYFFFSLALHLAAQVCGADFSFIVSLLVVPALVLIHMLPLTPMGVGTGEISGEWLYREAGVAGGSEIIVVLHLLMAIVSLFGIPAYLINLIRAGKNPEQNAGRD